MNRRIIIAPFLLVSNLFKKTRLDNFAGGLIFGAIFSLVVNIATVQIQDNLQKQRIFEALENEILANILQSNRTSEANLKTLENNSRPNFFYATQKYTKDIWTQSPEALQYVVQLDKSIQTPILIYYTITIPQSNEMLNKLEELRRSKLAECFLLDGKILTKSEIDICDLWHKQLIRMESDTAGAVGNDGFKLLEVFHPTQDRLKNPFLKLLLGDKSTRILSGE
jgi:hypothetical protein